MSKSTITNPKGSVPLQNNEIEWELRPGGMLVQRREDEDDGETGASSLGPMIKITVSNGKHQHEVFVPAQSTFGDIKKFISQKTGLEANEQRLLFRGKEKEDDEHLHMAGVKDNSKILLMEDPATRLRKVEEVKKSNEISKASEAIAGIRSEVSALEVSVRGGTKVPEKEFDISTELLMRQLLKLDGVEAEGEAKLQRKAEVRRVQNFVEALDTLKARNSNPFNNNSNAVSVTTKWETFDSGVGSLNAPPPISSSTKVTQDWEHPPPISSSTKVTQDWEQFD
ncbi:BAG family molecular chaperone regulator 4 isoform X2 [Ziziphus jujuba]|uniref:BAG family molecular chaperone regulator 4 isoform X2 n=1 Tax=Ziziphus jujuba TaxID=326968 RepID=A0A6P4AQI8_ZIZJJ|nr:BAG family molecular chaperone regulator 4 isoform X2 [Ziziphus jujuba]